MSSAAQVAGHTCSHRGNPVRVGEYTIYAGGTQYLTLADLAGGYDMLVPLMKVPESWRETETFHPAAFKCHPLEDFGGVSDDWPEFVQEIIAELERGKRILVFCIGSHGRTGTLLASLISVLEPDVEDPIAEARKRHCVKAVETNLQGQAVFALRGKPLPQYYGVLTLIPPGISKFGSTEEYQRDVFERVCKRLGINPDTVSDGEDDE